ncbi:phospholipase D-like domain-containing protein [Thalassotalea aquiviva]|uniref:phospholipase D-like domain-containing protein n=1 Tax=Thalassotalea aquiviva TaxID=3242415 RepID=UPI00352B846E
MKLVANGINNNFLESCLPSKEVAVDGVLAAIAYGSDRGDTPKLIKNCLENKRRLDIWMRYDHTVPVSPSLLETLLRNERNNIFCKLIPDMLHSKIIWWQGHGVYIGSANLTDRAWYSNIETGVFISDIEMKDSGMDLQIESFFEELFDLDKSLPLTKEIIKEQSELAALHKKKKQEIDDEAKRKRHIDEWEGVNFIPDKKRVDRKKQRFGEEWNETLSFIRNIASQINDYRPKWVDEDVPLFWQVDQFLHAYYYNQVRQPDNTYPFEEYFQKNHSDPQKALIAAMKWWSETENAPTSESITLYENAPNIRRILSKANINNIDENDLLTLCSATHATLDHVIKMPTSVLGKPEILSLSRDERLPLFAHLLFKLRNSKGQSIVEVLDYVLYGGKDQNLWQRLYEVGKLSEYRIKHYGINSIAEIVGWARPEATPPRNGRTNKALRALGYRVKIYI